MKYQIKAFLPVQFVDSLHKSVDIPVINQCVSSLFIKKSRKIQDSISSSMFRQLAEIPLFLLYKKENTAVWILRCDSNLRFVLYFTPARHNYNIMIEVLVPDVHCTSFSKAEFCRYIPSFIGHG